MNDLAKIDPPIRLTAFSAPWLAALRRTMGTENGRPTLATGFRVTEPQRRHIAAEISRMQGLLAPAGRKALAVELAHLTMAFPAGQAQSAMSAELRAEAYFEALHGVPAWAVADAKSAILRGEVAEVSPRFAPTPPEFRRVCDLVMRPVRKDLADLIAIRDASELRSSNPEERKRVSAGFERLKLDLATRDFPPSPSKTETGSKSEICLTLPK